MLVLGRRETSEGNIHNLGVMGDEILEADTYKLSHSADRLRNHFYVQLVNGPLSRIGNSQNRVSGGWFDNWA